MNFLDSSRGGWPKAGASRIYRNSIQTLKYVLLRSKVMKRQQTRRDLKEKMWNLIYSFNVSPLCSFSLSPVCVKIPVHCKIVRKMISCYWTPPSNKSIIFQILLSHIMWAFSNMTLKSWNMGTNWVDSGFVEELRNHLNRAKCKLPFGCILCSVSWSHLQGFCWNVLSKILFWTWLDIICGTIGGML